MKDIEQTVEVDWAVAWVVAVSVGPPGVLVATAVCVEVPVPTTEVSVPATLVDVMLGITVVAGDVLVRTGVALAVVLVEVKPAVGVKVGFRVYVGAGG